VPADPETMKAIYALGENLRNAVDARLNAHKEQADEARARIHERIESHARESRDQITKSTSELRGAMVVLGTQVTDLSARFGAHEKADEREFQRVDAQVKSAAGKRHGYVQAAVAAAFGGIAGWLSHTFGGAS
jgi:hypothetical protein